MFLSIIECDGESWYFGQEFTNFILFTLYLGILPRDGRNISFKELNKTIRATTNFSPTFCFFVPNFAANMLNKSYSKDTFDLAELDLHSENGIEHDASLTSMSVISHDILWCDVSRP